MTKYWRDGESQTNLYQWQQHSSELSVRRENQYYVWIFTRLETQVKIQTLCCHSRTGSRQDKAVKEHNDSKIRADSKSYGGKPTTKREEDHWICWINRQHRSTALDLSKRRELQTIRKQSIKEDFWDGREQLETRTRWRKSSWHCK